MKKKKNLIIQNLKKYLHDIIKYLQNIFNSANVKINLTSEFLYFYVLTYYFTFLCLLWR